MKEWRGKEFPKPPFLVTRNWVHALSILIEPLGSNAEGQQEVRNVVICSLKLPKLPQWFMEWILGKVFLILIDAMSTCAKNADAPGSTTNHAIRVKEDKFYSDFLDTRVSKYMDSKGLRR